MAGIHSELTGRENINIYGNLLGLRRKQVAARFDEIVAFAELEDAIDRQVKFYSSGMKMRLGFAVAAFLEPRILIVDEVLAVGDASFQQKCLDRMRTCSRAGRRCVLVSHDLAAVEATATRGIWLADGRVQADGPVRDVLRSYRESLERVAELGESADSVVRVVKAGVVAAGGVVRTQEPVEVTLVLRSAEESSGRVCIGVSEGPASPIFLLRHDVHLPDDAEVVLRCTIERLPLPRGRYFLWTGVFRARAELLGWRPVASFDVVGPDLDSGPSGIARLSPVHVPSSWEAGSA